MGNVFGGAGQIVRTVAGWFSQSEWMVRLLNLSRADAPRSEPGLVLIQIDGLGLAEFRRGLRERNLPFLRWLGRKTQGYASHPHYSGLPSNTPGVQGALFYGVPTCVPAFSFVDRSRDRVCHMFDQASAAAVEARLRNAGEPLLAGGSSYGNIFSGGAAAAHFCSTSMGWTGLLKMLNPPALTLAILLNLHIAVHAILLTALELVLAVVDGARGILTGRGLRRELGYIPMRVAICIVLREVVTAAVKIDVARGVRVIHANLAGYDEQAHHRGPRSSLARWSLRGIDGAVSRIWHAARRASRRDYAVWIYSDHGQQAAVPYAQEHGRPIAAAVAEVFADQLQARGWAIEHAQGLPHWRAKLLRPQTSPEATPAALDQAPQRVIVTAMGPLGHIYAPQELAPDAKAELAEALVRTAKIPLVMTAAAPGRARAWTTHGAYDLPEQAREIVGEDHPYLAEVAEDMVRLCQHPDAGTFVISGWRLRKPGTFATELGAHAGPGPDETSGFVYVPEPALAPPKDRAYVRTEDLRAAARRVLARTLQP
jgi:hypothetical protein